MNGLLNERRNVNVIANGKWIKPSICVICSCLVLNLIGCPQKPDVYVVPDSHDLTTGVRCQNWPTNPDMPVTGCTRDPNRVQITIGYLREILQRLDEKVNP